MQQEVERKQRELKRKREALEARIAAMRKEFDAEEEEAKRIIGQEKAREEVIRQDRDRMEASRRADTRAGSRRAARPFSQNLGRPQMKKSAKRAKPEEPSATAAAKEVWELPLYVAGQTPKSITAFANLKKLCEKHLPGR